MKVILQMARAVLAAYGALILADKIVQIIDACK